MTLENDRSGAWYLKDTGRRFRRGRIRSGGVGGVVCLRRTPSRDSRANRRESKPSSARALTVDARAIEEYLRGISHFPQIAAGRSACHVARRSRRSRHRQPSPSDLPGGRQFPDDPASRKSPRSTRIARRSIPARSWRARIWRSGRFGEIALPRGAAHADGLRIRGLQPRTSDWTRQSKRPTLAAVQTASNLIVLRSDARRGQQRGADESRDRPGALVRAGAPRCRRECELADRGSEHASEDRDDIEEELGDYQVQPGLLRDQCHRHRPRRPMSSRRR